MKAYCWASGLIEFGVALPMGAILIAEGGEQQLRRVMDVCARHGKGITEGKLLVPGVPEATTQQAKGDALGHWLTWCRQNPGRLRWNHLKAEG